LLPGAIVEVLKVVGRLETGEVYVGLISGGLVEEVVDEVVDVVDAGATVKDEDVEVADADNA
jgi:hypothetical protein